jgi:hypothetical protein
VRVRLFVQPSHRDIGARHSESPGAAIGDRLVVRDSNDRRFAPGQNRRNRLFHLNLKEWLWVPVRDAPSATSAAAAQEARRASRESARLVRMIGTRAPSTIPAEQ